MGHYYHQVPTISNWNWGACRLQLWVMESPWIRMFVCALGKESLSTIDFTDINQPSASHNIHFSRWVVFSNLITRLRFLFYKLEASDTITPGKTRCPITQTGMYMFLNCYRSQVSNFVGRYWDANVFVIYGNNNDYDNYVTINELQERFWLGLMIRLGSTVERTLACRAGNLGFESWSMGKLFS